MAGLAPLDPPVSPHVNHEQFEFEHRACCVILNEYTYQLKKKTFSALPKRFSSIQNIFLAPSLN